MVSKHLVEQRPFVVTSMYNAIPTKRILDIRCPLFIVLNEKGYIFDCGHSDFWMGDLYNVDSIEVSDIEGSVTTYIVYCGPRKFQFSVTGSCLMLQNIILEAIPIMENSTPYINNGTSAILNLSAQSTQYIELDGKRTLMFEDYERAKNGTQVHVVVSGYGSLHVPEIDGFEFNWKHIRLDDVRKFVVLNCYKVNNLWYISI